jgi:hypothetical protein
MWTTEHTIETSATPEAIWRLWADVPGWPQWNADIEQITLEGPFAAGSRIVMTPRDGEPIELRLAEADEPELFIDEADMGEIVVRTTHRVERLDAQHARVTYRMEITGPAADTLGPQNRRRSALISRRPWLPWSSRRNPDAETLMERVASGLYASPPEAVPFGPSLVIRAFLLRRERGNLLIYRAETLKSEQEIIDQLGGICRQYLNHRHEAAPVCDWVSEAFDAPLYCHADDAESASAGCTVAHTFSERHRLDDDFEIIPTPGHTSGATAYLWDSGEHRCLFTGDTIFFPQGEWRALLLRSNAPPPLDGASNRERYLESLELLRGLDFDLLVPSLATAGQPYYELVERADATRRIETIIERLRRGENG